jgi:hypothetical protein
VTCSKRLAVAGLVHCGVDRTRNLSALLGELLGAPGRLATVELIIEVIDVENIDAHG